MRFHMLFFLAFLGFGKLALAQTPTFSEDVATIFYNNCTKCHRTNGIGPFKLESYSDAVNRALAIKTAVSTGYMPPWPPDTTYSRFAHERVLNQEQISKIVQWVNGDTPQGNPANEPPVPVFSTNSQLSQPASATYTIPTYTIPTNQDDYRAFVLPNLSSLTQAVTEVEFMPANRAIVHHIIVYYDTSGICQQLDDADTLPGYVAFGGIGNANAKQIAGWVPGSPALRLPTNFGLPAYQNGKYVIQIHYAPGSAGQKDSTSFAVLYKPFTPTMREVFQVPILNHLTNMVNGPLVIPPNVLRKFVQNQPMPIPISVIGVTPHMHLIGKSKKVYALKPGASDTTRIVRINNWDFHWQGMYMFKKLMVLPMGTQLVAEAWYDNTSNNHHNPSHPPVQVVAGESTMDEMMVTFFMFVTAKAGDADIVLDSVLVTSKNQNNIQLDSEWKIYPNPSKDELFLVYPSLENGLAKASIQIWDSQGKVVKTEELNRNESLVPGSFRLSINHLKPGMYKAAIIQNDKISRIGFVKL